MSAIPYGTLRDIANELKNIREILEKQSSRVEERELVRCKDCKHNPKYTKDFRHGKCVYTCDDDWYACEPMDDFFCGHGER